MALRRHIWRGAAAALLSAAFLVPAPLNAGPYAGYVTAHSIYGNGSVSGPVRKARYGYQVRLPGGTWIYCSRGRLLSRASPCADTLRRESVDFWETMNNNFGSSR